MVDHEKGTLETDWTTDFLTAVDGVVIPYGETTVSMLLQVVGNQRDLSQLSPAERIGLEAQAAAFVAADLAAAQTYTDRLNGSQSTAPELITATTDFTDVNHEQERGGS